MVKMTLTASAVSVLSSLGQLIWVLLLFVLVLLLTLLTTRWIAKYQQGQLHNRNLKVIETLKVSANGYIQIIKAGDVYLVIAVSRDHIEKLAEVTEDQLEIDSVDATGQKIDMVESFHDILEKVKDHLPKK
ncbi:MAG: flagellar biosynthetic protein FliO [Eubacterium sp.]|nr:flagellar biosynthetic protein FliO [Eubacterium sp.]